MTPTPEPSAGSAMDALRELVALWERNSHAAPIDAANGNDTSGREKAAWERASAIVKRSTPTSAPAELEQLRAWVRQTYEQWCGRDFMHLPLPEAVGAAIAAREAPQPRADNVNPPAPAVRPPVPQFFRPEADRGVAETSAELGTVELSRLQERARTLAEDWHEGVPFKDVASWCNHAAGTLMALAALRPSGG